MRERALAKALGFLSLSALAVLGYLFLLSVARGKLGVFSTTVPALLLALAALALNWRFLRSERRSLADLGFDRPMLRIAQVAVGFLAGGLLAGAWAFAFKAVTSLSWHVAPAFDASKAIGAVTFAIFNNTGEELVYRGYLFLLLARAYGRTVAVVATCGLFTLLHIQGGVPWQSAIAGVLTSSLIFAAMFVRWRSVPLVVAFHVATNVIQELVGLRVSGLTLFLPTPAGRVNESQLYTVLLIVGLVNTALAVALFASLPCRDARDRSAT